MGRPKRSIFLTQQHKKRLFITTLTKSETMGSVTKDSRGNVLFITKAPNKNNRVIYKVSENFDHGDVGSEPSSVATDDDELSPVAKIEVDYVGSAVTAFLSVKYKKRKHRSDGSATGSVNSASQATGVSGASNTTGRSGVPKSIDLGAEPMYIDVYKAVKIPAVKFGAAVVDMRGQVVGKASQDPKEPLPTVVVAPGADAAAVVALACIVNGEM
mmetsp:Transcript_3757/g.4988  ORF Transcript_3757/g.4988 Transcript_3757/m.4988 type:complete len:214 (-) Transcript_3757:95-736(-)